MDSPTLKKVGRKTAESGDPNMSSLISSVSGVLFFGKESEHKKE